MIEDKQHVEKLLGAVFAGLRDENEPDFEKKRGDFVFHMMDWLDDLEDLHALFRSQDAAKEEAAELIVGFLYHVIPHLTEAGRLLLGGVPNPFSADRERLGQSTTDER